MGLGAGGRAVSNAAGVGLSMILKLLVLELLTTAYSDSLQDNAAGCDS